MSQISVGPDEDDDDEEEEMGEFSDVIHSTVHDEEILYKDEDDDDPEDDLPLITRRRLNFDTPE